MKYNRIIALLLAMVMIIGMIPTAWAAETTTATETTGAATETTTVETETTAPAGNDDSGEGSKTDGLLDAIAGVFQNLMGETTPSTTETTDSTETTEVTETTEATEATTVPTEPTETTDSTESTTASTETTDATESTTEATTESTVEENEDVGYVVVPGVPQGINFTNPAPLLEPVVGRPAFATFSARGLLSGLQPTAEESDDASDSAMKFSKNVIDNGDGTFKLHLEAYATGDDATVTQVPIPSDIVLILDESGSMNDCIECNHEMGIGSEGGTKVEDVTQVGNVLSTVTPTSTVLFKGHKIYGSEIWTYETRYMIVYPVDGTTRSIFYCKEHEGWYSTSHNPETGKHTGAKWIPFTKNGAKEPTSTKGVANESTTDDAWVCEVQFYCACNHNTQRMDALKSAVSNFITEVFNDSVSNNIDNRVAVAAFSSGRSDHGDITDNGVRYYSSTDVNNLAGSAFLPVATQKEQILNIINNELLVSGATETHNGIDAAYKIFGANPIPAGEKRNRVMILFTDGAPGSGYEFYDGTNGTQDWTHCGIETANKIKTEQGATVYTIGLFPGADASNPSNLPDYEASKDGSGQHNEAFFDNANRLLHLVSSNYSGATSMTNTGTVNSELNGASYYLSTENEEGLHAIFGKLASLVNPGSTTVTLGGTAVTKDIVTPYFKIPNAANVTAWTETFKGDTSWEKDTGTVSTETTGPLVVAVAGNTVTVTNFDFAENYVAMDTDGEGNAAPRGKKLVVEIPITPVDGFLGGDNIVTNTDESGVYADADDEEAVGYFEIPDVDVPLKEIDPKLIEQDIYVSQTAPLPSILNCGNYKVDGRDYSVDKIRNGYVDIVYTITELDASGNEIEGTSMTYTVTNGTDISELSDDDWNIPEGFSNCPILEADTRYKIVCNVISKNLSTNTKETENYLTVNVYKPVITYQDSFIDLGDVADYEAENYVNIVWKHDNAVSTNPPRTIQGTAPVLSYTFSPAEGAFKVDTDVQVTEVNSPVNANNFVPESMDIFEHATFFREECEVEGCDDHNPDEAVDTAEDGYINFIVHLNTFNLRIIKNISAEAMEIDPNASFVFRVTGPESFSMDVVINGAGEVVIEDLRVGTYTVTELDWSWRYDPDEPSKTVDGKKAVDGYGDAEFTNTRERIYWLDGENYAQNIFS